MALRAARIAERYWLASEQAPTERTERRLFLRWAAWDHAFGKLANEANLPAPP